MTADAAATRLRGLDSNQRPRGYEPRELPLLYPAKIVCPQRPVKVEFLCLETKLASNLHWTHRRLVLVKVLL